MVEAGVEQYARVHVRGYGGTGAAQGVLASLGSGTDGQEAGLQQSLLMLVAQKLLVYKHGIHKCSEFVPPKTTEKEVHELSYGQSELQRKQRFRAQPGLTRALHMKRYKCHRWKQGRLQRRELSLIFQKGIYRDRSH